MTIFVYCVIFFSKQIFLIVYILYKSFLVHKYESLHYEKQHNVKSLLLISYHTLQRFSRMCRLRYRYDFSSDDTDFTYNVRMVNGFCNAERILVFESWQSPLDSSRMQFRAPYRTDKLVGMPRFSNSQSFSLFFVRHACT